MVVVFRPATWVIDITDAVSWSNCDKVMAATWVVLSAKAWGEVRAPT